MAYILETRGLTKIYGRKEAAKDVNMHIEEGTIYGLIGRNGAGKTTIMRMISGLSAPTRGSYTLFGKSGGEMRRQLSKVGVLIETPGIYPRLSAYENLKIKCIGVGVRPKGYVEKLLKTVGLEEAEWKRPAGNFSLGMRQRLGIALAIAGDPKLLVLDEPINGLDPQGISEIRQILVRLRDEQGVTIMISSHILDELGKVADGYGIINEGTLIDEFSAEELQHRSGQYVVIRSDDTQGVADVLDGIGIRDVEFEEDGSLRVNERLEDTASMARAVVEAGIGLREIFLRSISLEDYYLGVMGGNQNG